VRLHGFNRICNRVTHYFLPRRTLVATDDFWDRFNLSSLLKLRLVHSVAQ
jgi:hypothetical protein